MAKRIQVKHVAKQDAFFKDMSICDRLSQTRKLAGQTQEQMAEDLQMKISTLKHIETHRHLPTLEVIRRWHHLYKRSYEWIIEGV